MAYLSGLYDTGAQFDPLARQLLGYHYIARFFQGSSTETMMKTNSMISPFGPSPFPGRGVVALNGCVGSRRGGDIYPTKVSTYPKAGTIPTIFLQKMEKHLSLPE